MDNTPGWNDTQKIIALVITVSFILIVILWLFFPPGGDPGAIAVLNTLVGTLGSGFGAIVMYFFGSSKGSTEKDNTIKEMAATTGTGSGSPQTTVTTVPTEPSTTPTTTTVTKGEVTP